MTDITLEQRARELIAKWRAESDATVEDDAARELYACADDLEAALRLPAGADHIADAGKLVSEDHPVGANSVIPDGWVLVPREPTNEMFEAAASFGGGGGYSRQRGCEAIESWGHMLAVAPRHETGEGS